MIRRILSRILRRDAPAPVRAMRSEPVRMSGAVSLVPVIDVGPSARRSTMVLSPDLADFVRVDGEPDPAFLQALLATVERHVVRPLDGGYALVADDEVLFHPQCCGALDDLDQWRHLPAAGTIGWHEVWIGHPCLLALRDGEDILLSGYVEPGLDLARPPPELAIFRIAADRLAAAVTAAEASCRAAVPVFARHLPKPSEPVASVLLGLEPATLHRRQRPERPDRDETVSARAQAAAPASRAQPSRGLPDQPDLRTSGVLESVIIGYLDAYGVVLERTITASTVQSIAGSTYLEAFCTLRGERRTFRTDRIMRMLTTDRQDLGNPLAVLADRTAGFRQAPVIVVPPAHERAMIRIASPLTALIWMTRSHRDFDAAEMRELLGFVGACLALDHAEDRPAWDRRLAAMTIDEAAPREAAAVEALRSVPANAPLAVLWRDTSARIVCSAGRPDPDMADRRARLLEPWR